MLSKAVYSYVLSVAPSENRTCKVLTGHYIYYWITKQMRFFLTVDFECNLAFMLKLSITLTFEFIVYMRCIMQSLLIP